MGGGEEKMTKKEAQTDELSWPWSKKSGDKVLHSSKNKTRSIHVTIQATGRLMGQYLDLFGF